jgi:hypothetical protein
VANSTRPKADRKLRSSESRSRIVANLVLRLSICRCYDSSGRLQGSTLRILTVEQGQGLMAHLPETVTKCIDYVSDSIAARLDTRAA